jgi:hypothetical protein
MARGMMERVLNPEQLDQGSNTTAKEQYTKDLLFSSVFDLMSQVVCGSRPSVNAAYQASKEEKYIGSCDTGTVYEQRILVVDPDG